MGQETIEKAVAKLKKPRLTLYLNRDRVKNRYDLIGARDRAAATKVLAEEIGIGPVGWLTGLIARVAGRKSLATKKRIQNSPELMALILERHLERSNRLACLPAKEDVSTPWVKCVGLATLTLPKGEVLTEKSHVSAKLANLIEAERREQEENAAQFRLNKEAQTFVVVFPEEKLVSVAMTNWADVHNIMSAGSGRLGIFGSLEKRLDKTGLTFVAPYWIWREI